MMTDLLRSRHRGLIPGWLFLPLFLALTAMFSISEQVLAQFGPGLVLPPNARDRFPSENDPFRRLPRDPLTQASTFKAMQALQAGEITTGLETVQELLDRDSDFFIFESGQTPRSQFDDLEALIIEHREDYERLFGSVAAQLLTEARSGQNRAGLEEIVRRYRLTNAGASALAELARIDRDRGEPSLAAREFAQLAAHPVTKTPAPLVREAIRLYVQNGQQSQARALAHRFSKEFPDQATLDALISASRKGAPPLSGDALIYEWRTPFGSDSQTGQSWPAPALFDDAWRAELIDDQFDFPSLLAAPEVALRLGAEHRQLLKAVEQQIRGKSDRIAMPAARPLIVNDLVILSAPGSVKAFQLQTGQLVWNGVDLDETFEYLARQSYSAGDAHDAAREEMRELFAAARGWRDLTSCSLSTDGQRVYAISNCQLVGTTNQQRIIQNTQRHSLLPQRSNRLSAYDLSTDGKKLWSVGTPGDDAPLLNGEEPREIFFLGAPLPVEGRLYILGEERGQIQLFELDPTTGSVLWSLGLLNPDRDLLLDDVRRLAGLMPAYGNGLLYCPAGEGAITAVDPRTRRVVWTHFYSEAMAPLQRQILLMRMMRPQNVNPSQSREELLTDHRWFDARVMVSGDVILFTPPDDDSLLCLDAASGRSRWETTLQRGQLIYAATLFDDKVILVGRNEVSALSLADGKSAWKSPVPIPGPSGRGLRMGDQFLQPLTSGEIAVIHLKTGHLLTRIPLKSGDIPGNLVASNGHLVMQTASSLIAFRARSTVETELARQFADNPEDPVALASRGTWRLQQGELAQGLADLKTAVARPASSEVKQVLAWALLEGLRTDFAKYRDQASLIDEGLKNPLHRLQFLRTYAQGLQSVGDYGPAFEHYLEILRILPWPETRIVLGDQWSATDSSWVLTRLDELLSITDEPTQQQLKSMLTDWVRQSTDLTLLMRVLPAMPMDWLDPMVVLERLSDSDEMETALNERESILRKLLTSQTPEVKAGAAAQLLNLALRAKDEVTAHEMLAELESRDVSLKNGTSRDLARSFRQQAEVADLLHSDFFWPEHVREADQAPAQIRESLMQIPLLGPPSASLAGWTFFMEAGGANLQVFDQHGQRHCRVATNYGGARFATDSDLGRYVCMYNHLVLVVLMDRFLILDFQSDSASPRLLVMREFPQNDQSLMMTRGSHGGIPRPGLRSMQTELRGGRMASNVGPLTDSVLCYTAAKGILAINPITGAELWERRDIPAGMEILGDENYVILKPSDDGPVRILRARDGSDVKTTEFPADQLNCVERRYGDWGRFLPMVETAHGQFVFRMFDPVREVPVWSYQGPVGTRWSVISGQKIAFLAPNRKLSIRDGMTGREIFETTLSYDGTAEQFFILEFADQWIFCGDTRLSQRHRPVMTTRRNAELVHADVDGPVLAISRADGKTLWSRSVANQEVLTQGPSAWPVLVFCRFRGLMNALILKRTTGEVIREKQTRVDELASLSWLSESRPTRIHLKFGNDRMTLLFSVEPPAPPRDKPATAPTQQEEEPREDR